MSTFPTTTRGVRAALFGRYTPSQSLTEVVPTQSVAISRQGEQITEQDDPSPRLMNLLEQENPRTQTAKAGALRLQRMLGTSVGIRAVIRSR